jgi:transposase-like protein
MTTIPAISTGDGDEAAAAARSLTDRIKVAVEATWHLVAEAYTTRAWSALGYASWDEYTTREFGTSRLRLPREDRQEVVGSLREAGLSLRAIASATGTSDQTVQRDLRQVQQITTPDNPPIKGTDGKTYPSSHPRIAEEVAQSSAPSRGSPAGTGGNGAFVRAVTPLMPPRNVPKTSPAKQPPRPEPYRAPELGRTMSQLLARGNEVVVHASAITERMLVGQSAAAAIWLERVTEITEPLQSLARLLERASEVQA